jgi:hypothetical protein
MASLICNRWAEHVQRSTTATYKLRTRQELEAIMKHLDEHMARCFTRPSPSLQQPRFYWRESLAGEPVCWLPGVEWDNYISRVVREILDRPPKVKIFSKLDIINACNRTRMKEGHEWLTAFNTRHGQYECLAMPFGLRNTPGTFQGYISAISGSVLRRLYRWYYCL